MDYVHNAEEHSYLEMGNMESFTVVVIIRIVHIRILTKETVSTIRINLHGIFASSNIQIEPIRISYLSDENCSCLEFSNNYYS